MKTGFRISLSAGWPLVAFVSALLLVPVVSSAQTLFGSGGITNSATDTPNVAFGWKALFSITAGEENTAIGNGALCDNTVGNENTANGVTALYYNTTGSQNTAIGWHTLYDNYAGNKNTANGASALFYNTTGYENLANGFQSLFRNTTGHDNTAGGVSALYANTTGSSNIAIGAGAGSNLTTGSNNIDIGNSGVPTETRVIRIGTSGDQSSTYIAGITGAAAARGVAVYIDAAGKLGTITSSRRFKKDIHDMGRVSDKLMQLRPVSFRYKEAADDGSHPVQYGLIAEEVAKVYPDLVQYDKSGKPFTIYYHLLTPMLLNELQKEHRQNVAQNARITALTVAHNSDKAEIASLKAAHTSEVTSLRAELAALKQAQQQQLAAVTKLTALVQASQNQVQPQRAVYAH